MQITDIEWVDDIGWIEHEIISKTFGKVAETK